MGFILTKCPSRDILVVLYTWGKAIHWGLYASARKKSSNKTQEKGFEFHAFLVTGLVIIHSATLRWQYGAPKIVGSLATYQCTHPFRWQYIPLGFRVVVILKQPSQLGQWNLQRDKTHPTIVLGMTPYCIWWWGSSCWALGNVEYPLTAITPSNPVRVPSLGPYLIIYYSWNNLIVYKSMINIKLNYQYLIIILETI